jgi:hypothetical protein
MILDYMVQFDVPLEIAVRLTRDSVTQNALLDDNGRNLVQRFDDVTALNATLELVAEALLTCRTYMQDTWESLWAEAGARALARNDVGQPINHPEDQP